MECLFFYLGLLKVIVSTYDLVVLDWGYCLLLNVFKLELEFNIYGWVRFF